MALGVLGIILIVLVIVGLALQGLLYIGKYRNENIVFIANVLFSFLVAYMSFTALPSNYTAQKVLAVAFGLVGLLAGIMRIQSRKSSVISKVMVSISIVGGIVQLLIA